MTRFAQGFIIASLFWAIAYKIAVHEAIAQGMACGLEVGALAAGLDPPPSPYEIEYLRNILRFCPNDTDTKAAEKAEKAAEGKRP